MGLQPHYITKKEMIEIKEQTTTKVEYPKRTGFRRMKKNALKWANNCDGSMIEACMGDWRKRKQRESEVEHNA